MAKILVVEDDEQLRQGLQELLSSVGYETQTASDLKMAEKVRTECAASGDKIALYLLDIMLQNQSGFTFCQEIRQKEDTPVIFLSALDDEEPVIRGLELGGDDYITKPFRSRELLARIAAHLRRVGNFDMNTQHSGIQSGDILFRREQGRVLISGQEITLRRVEWELLSYFLESNGRLLRREQLLEYIWDSGEQYVEDNTLTVQVSRLRKQLGKYHDNDYIETVRGIGYRWCQDIRIV